jgi:dTDP-4-dehydrorhamnose reductase
MKVTILGASGMLGSMLLDWLAHDTSLNLTSTVRDPHLQQRFQAQSPGVEWRILDAGRDNLEQISAVVADSEWIINAIGVIKPYIHDDNSIEVERAIRVNALFPHLLAQAAEQQGCRVLQIATDCVYAGSKGRYIETDSHDPLDVYGKSKSMGEVNSAAVYHLRCSIIGPEPKGHVSLLDWFLGQPKNGSVGGYVNHQWNGVTTLHFARLCRGIIQNTPALPHIQHLIPTGSISKYELLRSFAQEYNRSDIAITPTEAKVVIDRTLDTVNNEANQQLWMAAGYPQPPSVSEMVAELAAFNYRFAQ